MSKEISKEVKIYKYKVNKESHVEIEIENERIKSIDVYLQKPQSKSNSLMSYYSNDMFSIKQTKQFKELVDVFNEIVKDFYDA